MRLQPRYKKADKIGKRYQVHEVLMGGMGEVYLCLDLEENIPFALKTFQARFLTNPRLRELFKREIATWVALEKHPNIVRCFFMDTIDNQPFMFLEWVTGDPSRGTDLRRWLSRGPLGLRMGLDLAIDICRGLIHAAIRQPGIVHRDLKPENILIGIDWVAKITDFGLAKVIEEATPCAESTTANKHALIAHSGVVGTPSYMAPEQWRGELLDARTDIYAVGCILYEILNGRSLYSGKDVASIQRQHLLGPLPKLAGQSASYTVDQLLARCLAKRKEERYQTVQELLDDLSTCYLNMFQSAPRLISGSTQLRASDHLARSLTYGQLGQYDQALADAERAVELDAEYAHAHYGRGMIYRHIGRYQEALADQNRTIEIEPSFTAAFGERAAVSFKLGEFQDAIQDYTRAIDADPGNGKLYTSRGSAYCGLHIYDKGLADLDQAIALDESLALAYHARGIAFIRLKDEINAISDFLGDASLGSILAPRRFLTSDNDSRSQLPELALTDFTLAIDLDPMYAQSYLERALLLVQKQLYGQALKDFSMAIQIDPSATRAYIGRGIIHEKLSQFDEAVADFTSAIELHSHNAEAYEGRAAAYAQMNQHDRAVEDLSQLILLRPTDSDAFYNRGRAHVDLGEYSQALDDYGRAIELAPNFAIAYNNRGYVSELQGRFDDALNDYQRAIELEPNEILTYLNRGNTLDKMNRSDDAMSDYRKAAELDPTSSSPPANIAAALGNRGALGQALPYFDQAAKMGDARAAQNASQVRQQLGLEPGELANPFQLAFEALRMSNSLDSIWQAVERFPRMIESEFLETLNRVIDEQVPQDSRAEFHERLKWLRQVAGERDRS